MTDRKPFTAMNRKTADPTVPFEQQFGTFDPSGCRDLSLIGKTGVGHHPHSLSPCDTIVRFLAKPEQL